MKTLMVAVFTLVAMMTARPHGAAAQGSHTVRVANRSLIPVRYIYIKSQGFLSQWSGDLLGALNVIPMGYYQDVEMDDGRHDCSLDINVKLFDRRETTFQNVNVCAASELTITDQIAVNRFLTIVNRTSARIRYVHVGAPGGNWSADLLGAFVTIEPDNSLPINVYRAVSRCSMSVLIKFYDGREWKYDDVDVCEHDSLTVMPAKQ